MSLLRHPRSVALAVAAATAMLAVLSAGGPASADSPLDTAKAQAHTLALSVKKLQDETETAAENYDRTAGTLADATATRLQAQDSAAAASQQAIADRGKAGLQARALYQSGGTLALYAGALSSGDIGSLADRVASVQRLTAQDQALDATADSSADAASKQAAALAAAEAKQLTLETAAANAAAKEKQLLAQQSALLDAANAQVKALVIQQQQEMEAAAQAAFQAQLADAYAAAGVPLTLGATTMSAANGTAANAVTAMQALVNVHPPYVWGGTGPTGFDCSGLTGAAYAAAGLNLPRTAAQQWLSGPHPALADLRPGDLLFWATDTADPGSIHHVAMYAGGDLMWSTDHTGDVARLQPIWADGFMGATRPVAALAAAVGGPRWHSGA